MRVLTIDFDCIMAPCIKLYNEKCFGDENPTVIWNALSNDLNIDNFLCYDARILEDIILLIQRSVNSGAKFVSIVDHQNVVDVVKDLRDDEKIDLVNIDFHHDVWYNRESLNSIEMFDQYNCSNWVGYLYKTDRLNSYTWYKMYGSDLFDCKELSIPTTIKKNSEIKGLDGSFDVIYFCLSPQWVPYKYHHLYDIIVKLFGGKADEHTNGI